MGIRRLIFITLFLALTVLPVGESAWAQQLSTEAQEAFDRGLDAAKQKAWDLAIEYFTTANYSGPKEMRDRHPAVLQNLGLAYARAGDELPAIAYLEMYLAVAPGAPNAAPVRKEIRALEVGAEAKAQRIFREITNIVLQAKDAKWQRLDTIAIEKASTCQVLLSVAVGQAYLGHISDASQTAGLGGCKSLEKNWEIYSKGNANLGQYVGPVWLNAKSFDEVVHRHWQRFLEIIRQGYLRINNMDHISGTNQMVLKAKTEQLEDVPYGLYGVAGSLAYWLMIAKGNRALLDGDYRQEWQKRHKSP